MALDLWNPTFHNCEVPISLWKPHHECGFLRELQFNAPTHTTVTTKYTVHYAASNTPSISLLNPCCAVTSSKRKICILQASSLRLRMFQREGPQDSGSKPCRRFKNALKRPRYARSPPPQDYTNSKDFCQTACESHSVLRLPAFESCHSC